MKFAILLLAGVAWGQKPAGVEGVVSNSATGGAVKKALVTLRSVHANAGYQALSDAAGHFRIDNVQPGSYGLWAEAPGFVREFGRFFAPSQAVTVAEGAVIHDFSIRLTPMGAISGRVLDENGEPVAGASVDGLRYTYSAQGPHLGHWAGATTNDRGEYRVFDLEPGRWYLRVNKKVEYPSATGRVHRSVADMEYGENFYPAVARVEEASPIEIGPGADLAQMDVRIRKASVYRVRGKVVDAGGAPAAQAKVEIEDVGSVESHADGSFDARAVPRGPHRLSAALTRELTPLIAGWQEVLITDRDVEGVILRLGPMAMIQGTAAVEGSTSVKLQGARVSLEPLTGLWETVRSPIGEDGRFALDNVAPQSCRLTLDRLPAGLYLKSARLGDQELTDSGRLDVAPGSGPLALVLAADGGRVEGMVQSDGPGIAPIVVTLAPSGRFAGRRDLVKTVDTESGRFLVEGIAPGDYQLWAWEMVDEDLAAYPDFRKVLESKATAVTVHAGEKQSVTLQTITAAQVAEARGKLR